MSFSFCKHWGCLKDSLIGIVLVLDNDYSNGISFWVAALSTVPFLADTFASCFWRYCVRDKFWPVRKLLASLEMSCSCLACASDYCIKFPFITPSSYWGFIKPQSVMFSWQGAVQLPLCVPFCLTSAVLHAYSKYPGKGGISLPRGFAVCSIQLWNN